MEKNIHRRRKRQGRATREIRALAENEALTTGKRTKSMEVGALFRPSISRLDVNGQENEPTTLRTESKSSLCRAGVKSTELQPECQGPKSPGLKRHPTAGNAFHSFNRFIFFSLKDGAVVIHIYNIDVKK
ncbi:hypothetical protein HNY73_003356 [Argiope bruennichi]|uniref:Uncharacterized protein n=1 Tax=Argiope bruennichi TaxID=94029 RepID=A0A8T0FKW9_ARGBR|nr:hypothetical protein HNY73_003356 [Argiope bruennichi]